MFLGKISLLNLAQKLNQRAMFSLKDLSALCGGEGEKNISGGFLGTSGQAQKQPHVAHVRCKNACCSKHLQVVAGTFYRGSPLSEAREWRPERKEILSEAEPEIQPGVERIPEQQKHIHQKQRQIGDAAQNRSKELPVRADFTGKTSRGMHGKLYNSQQPIIGA